ncbi:MAG: DUF2341 domain-containing protein [Candidatus Nanosalina sp.]
MSFSYNRVLSVLVSLSFLAAGASAAQPPDFQKVGDDSGGQVKAGNSVKTSVYWNDSNGLETANLRVNRSFERRYSTGTFQTPTSTGRMNVTDIGFEPDIIEFRVSGTISEMNKDVEEGTNTADQAFSWSHGFALKNETGIKQNAMTVAGNSESQDEHTSGARDNASIYLHVQRDGSYEVVAATATGVYSENNGTVQLDFTRVCGGGCSLSRYSNFTVHYTAYKFGNEVKAEIGSFQEPSTTGTQTVSTGFQPNYLRVVSTPTIESMDSDFSSVTDGSDAQDNTFGWSHGTAVKNDTGIEQIVASVSGNGQSINGHAYAASNSEIIRNLYINQDGAIQGRDRANLTEFTTNGFKLNWKQTYSGSYAPVSTATSTYLAIKLVGESPEIGYFKTPASASNVSVKTGFKPALVKFTAANTIDDIDTQGQIGPNVADGTFGWMHGTATSSTDEYVQMYATHSNSVNGHAMTQFNNQSLRLLYTDNDGVIQGKDFGHVRKINKSGFEVEFQNIYSGTYKHFSKVPVIYTAFPSTRNSYRNISAKKFGGSTEGWANLTIPTYQGETGKVCWNQWANDTTGLWQTSMTEQCFDVLKEPVLEADGSFQDPSIYEKGFVEYTGVCSETGGKNTVDAQSVVMTLQENSTGTWNDVTGSGSIRANKTTYSLGTVENGTSESRAYSVTVDNPGDYHFRTKCGSSNAPIDNSNGKLLQVKEAYGKLEVSLDKPSTIGVNKKEYHKEFWLNASITCSGPTTAATCGKVNSTVFYGKNITDTWFNSSWGYRKKIEIENTGSSKKDYQHRIELNLSEEYSQGKVKSGCEDLRTTYYNSSTGTEKETGHWIESCNVASGGNVTLWTKIPELEASSNTTSYVYYGNPEASSGSNISAVTTSKIVAGRIKVPSDAGWEQVSLGRVFEDPAVIATSTSENSAQSPKIAQVTNVSHSSFQVRMCEGESGCDTHPPENISYMVFETGKVDSLAGVEAGTVALSGGDIGSASTISYGETFSSTPRIIAQAQNTSRTPPTVIQGANTGTSSADLYTCQHNGGDGCNSVGATEVDWIALEPGNVPFSSFETGTASGIGNSAWTPQSFSTSFSAPPVVTAMIQTNSGGQQAKPSMARSVTASGMDMRYCEHDSGDTCDGHAAEDVSWFATGSKRYDLRNYTIGQEKQGSFEINDSEDTPFYVKSQPEQCGSLSYGDSCQVSWRVNSTGNVFDQWKLFSSFASNYTQIKDNVTEPATVEISDFTPPEWSDLNATNSTPLPGDDVNFSAYWTDNYELGQWKFSWNASGSFVNKTSGDYTGIGWSNTTVEIPAGSKGKTIYYRFYGSDTSNNYNLTDEKKVYVGSPPDNTDPVINQFNVTPDRNGYKRDVTFRANITDNVAVYNAKANITTPGGDVVEKPLTKIKDGVWQANYSDWQQGTHSFYIWANDTGANTVDTSGSPKTFEIQANTSFYLETKNESYPAFTDVELTSASSGWWNYSYRYRKPVQVTENSGQDLENYPVNISLDTASLISQGKMRNDCGDIRPVDPSTGKLLDYWIESGCNTQDTKIFVELNISASSTKEVNVYYGNSNAGSLSSKSGTMELMQVGTIQVNSSVKRVKLSRPVENPVVIASPPSENNVQSGTGRIDAVNSTGFNLTFEEEPAQDGTHPQETFYYMVAPNGSYQLTSGERLQASSYSTNTECVGAGTCNWDTRSFYSSFSTAPVVLAKLQSSNNDSFAYTTQSSVTGSDFRTAIGKPATKTGHGTEEIGWIAIEPGTGTTSDGTSFESTITPNTITGHDDGWTTVNFQNSYTSPLLLSTMQTFDGADGGWLRRRALNSGSVEMHVDEDQLGDTEQSHTSEVAGMFVTENPGTYPMRKYLASEPSGNVGGEEKAASHVKNIGSTNTSGQLLIQVQRNSTGEVLFTAVNDSAASTTRKIDSGEIFEIGSIYNTNAWNSADYGKGYYKIVAYLTNPGNDVLNNSDGTEMVGETVFYLDVTPPNWTALSINNTSPEPGQPVKFSANWSDDGSLDKWELYWNESGFFKKQASGSFDRGWSNTTLDIPSGTELDSIGYYFKGYDTKGNSNRTVIRSFKVEDVTPPAITGESVDSNVVDRFEEVNITASITDNGDISHTWVGIQVPGGGANNYSLENTSTDLYYRNFSSSQRGDHNATFYANDTYGNEGSSSTLEWDVYGLSNISLEKPVGDRFDAGSQVEVVCRVRDNYTGSGIENYPVDFYRNSTKLGVNTTNATGIARFTWDTSGLPEGAYSVNCRIDDNATLFYHENVNKSSREIKIEVPKFRVRNFEHENSVLHGLNEYDAGDTISWQNATINNTGEAPADDVNITVDVLDSAGNPVSWFAEKKKQCGAVSPYSACQRNFSSETVPKDVSGRFTWRVTVDWNGGGTPPEVNRTGNFTVHRIPENTSSALAPSEVVYGGNSSYNVTVENPWSTTISGLNVSLYCGNSSISCSTRTGQADYYFVGTLGAGESRQVNFTIDTSPSTPPANYDVNVSLNYSNVDEDRMFTGVANRVLKVRPPTPLQVNLSTPASAAREGLYNFSGSVKNTGSTQVQDVWLNYSLPSSWKIEKGSRNRLKATLAAGSVMWNNVTVNITSSSGLGQFDVRLSSASQNEREDFEVNGIDVLSNTSLAASINQSPVLRNQSVRMKARLERKNGSRLAGEEISFRLGGNLLGTNTTNSSGIAVLDTRIPYNQGLGSQTLNISYIGSQQLDTRGTVNTTAVTVDDSIKFAVYADRRIGYGKNYAVKTSVDSLVSLDTVNATFTYPNGTTIEKEMSKSGGNFTTSLDNLWKPGSYSFSVSANNSAGFMNTTSSRTFELQVNATISLDTEREFYGPNKKVYLEGRHWWNSSWKGRVELGIDSAVALKDVRASIANLDSKYYSFRKREWSELQPGDTVRLVVEFDLPAEFCSDSCQKYRTLTVDVTSSADGQRFQDAARVTGQISKSSPPKQVSVDNATGKSESFSVDLPDTGKFLERQGSLNIALGLIMVFILVLATAVKKRRGKGRGARVGSSRKGKSGEMRKQKPNIVGGQDDEDGGQSGKEDQQEGSDEEDGQDEEAADGDGSFECSVCGEEFDTESGRDLHEEAIH